MTSTSRVRVAGTGTGPGAVVEAGAGAGPGVGVVTGAGNACGTAVSPGPGAARKGLCSRPEQTNGSEPRAHVIGRNCLLIRSLCASHRGRVCRRGRVSV